MMPNEAHQNKKADILMHLLTAFFVIFAGCLIFLFAYCNIPKNCNTTTKTIIGTPTGTSYLSGIGKTRIYFDDNNDLDVDNYDIKIITGKKVSITLSVFSCDSRPPIITVSSINIIEGK
jgi:hypothetical protein